MWPIGHIGFSVFPGDLLDLNVLAVGIGAILPDLLDKPGPILIKSGHSRYIGHTLLAVFLVGFIFVALKKRDWGVGLSFGMLLHLFEDAPGFIPWFYPFIKYDLPPETFLKISFWEYLWKYYFSFQNLKTEFFALLLIGYVIYKHWSEIVSSPLYGRVANLQVFETLESIFHPFLRK